MSNGVITRLTTAAMTAAQLTIGLDEMPDIKPQRALFHCYHQDLIPLTFRCRIDQSIFALGGKVHDGRWTTPEGSVIEYFGEPVENIPSCFFYTSSENDDAEEYILALDQRGLRVVEWEELPEQTRQIISLMLEDRAEFVLRRSEELRQSLENRS